MVGEQLIRILNKSCLDSFFKQVYQIGDIFAPVKLSKDTHSFKRVKSLPEVDFSYTRTMIPPKKFFIPPRETIFTFNKEEAAYHEPNLHDKTVIFGVHSCDINALNLLDEVYIEGLPDKYYTERRKNTFLIGISCVPDEHCFCKSTGTSYARDGFELFLHDIGDRYFVRVGSERGYLFVQKNRDLFTEISETDISRFKDSQRVFLDSFTLDLEMHGLQDLLDLSQESSIWTEYGERCLSCGSCNLACPRCRCYDVRDTLNLDLNSGERERKWYSCMLEDHGLVAGGHNFRPTPTERLKNRFNCKGSLKEDMPNCVGCGRCTAFCPADIDFVEVIKKIGGDLL